MKIVIDCNVLIAASLKDGMCRKVLRNVIQSHESYISEPILLEFLQVARRKKFKKYQTHLEYYIQLYADVAKIINPNPCKIKLPDTDDIMYLDLCTHIQAAYLITGNSKDFPDKKYEETIIISPAHFFERYILSN
jgi:putative PIN family toxin of toxin-antitoxin system